MRVVGQGPLDRRRLTLRLTLGPMLRLTLRLATLRLALRLTRTQLGEASSGKVSICRVP